MKRWTILLALRLAVGCAWLGGDQDATPEIIRFHVKANSDSEADQTVKLAVRDALLPDVRVWLEGAENTEEAQAILSAHAEDLRRTADEVLEKNGATYTARVALERRDFPVRTDEAGQCYPAGEYEALMVYLGQAQGRNWWGVAYPGLSLPGRRTLAEIIRRWFR